MDFEKLNADVNMILTKHFTPGRGGKPISFIGIHYNYGDLTVEGCYSVWQTREASAHYQVESSGRIGQLVWDSNTAWALGNFDKNQRSINIEHANKPDGSFTEACLENGAHLVAALCKYYKLGRPQWGVNVIPHKQISPTSCPGELYGRYKDDYIKRAQKWYDAMTGTSPAPSTPSTPSTSTGSSSTTSSSAEKTGTGFGGTYRCNTAVLNVRSAPSTSSSVMAQYKSGQTVNLDDWYKIAEGYVWGRYTGASSGQKRYVAVGKATGKPESNDYLVKVSGGSSSTTSAKSIDEIAREVIAGKWGNGNVRKQKLTAAGYDYSAVQKRVNQLL